MSDHNLEIELGRRRTPKIEAKKRLCVKCNANEIEDEFHFVLDCSIYYIARQNLFQECGVTLNNQNRESIFNPIVNCHIAFSKYIKNTHTNQLHRFH